MKKLRLAAFLLLLGMFSVNTSYCQKNLEPAYLITLKGDTLNGFIHNRNKEKNPKSVVFRKEIGGQDISYKPTEIKKFKILDEVYESAIVTIDDSPIKDDELTFSKEFQPRVDTIFLRTLFEGEKSLFYYLDEKRREHFFIRQGSDFERLVYKKFLVHVDGHKNIKTNKSFIGQLSLYFQNCPSIQPKISQLQYYSRDLINVFQHYYSCTESNLDFQQKNEKILTEFGGIAGLTSTKLRFYSSKYEYLVNEDFPESIDLAAGFSLDIILPRNHRKWSIYNELLYNSYTAKGEYEVSSDYLITRTETTLEYSYIRLNNLLRFKYPVQNMFMFLNAGVSNGFAIKETNALRKESAVYSKVSVMNTKAVDHSTKLEQGVLLGVGSQFKNYSFEARYEKGNGMSRTMGLKSSTTRLHFLLGYRL